MNTDKSYLGSSDLTAESRSRAQVIAARDAYVATIRKKLENVSTEQLKKLWDAYDGSNAPLGFAGEDIHLELNMRGEGHYCAV